MIVLVGGEKGGTGKSTLATNLAAALARSGKDVLIVDADRQSTASSWCSERAQREDLPKVHCVQKYDNLFETVKDLESRYEEIIIDAGGRDSVELRSAMVAADKLFSPVRASQSDLWTIDHLNEVVSAAAALNPNLKAKVVLSMAPTNPKVAEAVEAAEMLKDFQPRLSLADTIIRERKVFRDSMCEGTGVLEAQDPKAIHEIKALVWEVYGAQV